MKTRTWVLLLCATAVLCAGLSLFLLLPGKDAAAVEILSEGKLLDTLPLNTDRTITVNSAYGQNIITIQGGKIAVTEADCPDGYCMDRGFCSSGAQIVCLPNQLVIRFVGQSTVDGVAG